MAANDSGRFGENEAAKFLSQKGWKIIERNYRTRFGEIDIIAACGKYLVFAEVKTRMAGSLILPREAVDFRKRQRIIATARMYLSNHGIGDLQPRFDVIEVGLSDNKNFRVKKINIIENAFGA